MILSSLSSSYGDVSITTGTGPTGKESIVLYNDGNVKLTLTYFISLLEAGAELSATSRVSAPGAPAASVTSTIGFKMKTEENNNFQWVPISDPVLQEAPVPVPVPSLVNQESKPTFWNGVKKEFDSFMEARQEFRDRVFQNEVKTFKSINNFVNARFSEQDARAAGEAAAGFTAVTVVVYILVKFMALA